MRALIIKCTTSRRAKLIAEALRLEVPLAAVTHNDREVYTDASPKLVSAIRFRLAAEAPCRV